MAPDNPLSALDALIINNRGALYESIVFQSLKTSPYIVRSFAFALADGALYCGPTHYQSSSFATRLLFETLEQQDLTAGLYLPFDVKSTTGREAGQQVFITNVNQLRTVAFYIGLFAADCSFVAIFPNLNQQAPNTKNNYGPARSDVRELSVNHSVRLHIPPHAYLIDPVEAPYLMPLSMLPEAISRIRLRARGGEPYCNPWTHVAFPEWQPSCYSVQALLPAESTPIFSSFTAIRDIYRAIRTSPFADRVSLEFMDIQPRIADFKLLTPARETQEAMATRREATELRQSFVQHKLDNTVRWHTSPLQRVPIARRRDSSTIAWYFSAFDRFDFIWYQLRFTNGRLSSYYESFFLPEQLVPDEWYTTLAHEECFERPEWIPYRIPMDADGAWIGRILDIILAFPRPRREGLRPLRSSQDPRRDPTHVVTGGDNAISDREPLVGMESTLGVNPLPTSPAAPANRGRQPQRRPQSRHGRHQFRVTNHDAHQRFFHRILEECCQRRSGLLFALGADHPLGDYGFTTYQWTEEECERFRTYRCPPKRVHELSAWTPTVSMYYCVRSLESTFLGPNVSYPTFRRLDSDSSPRLVIWDVFGADEVDKCVPLCVVPSTALGLTEDQQVLFQRCRTALEQRKRPPRTPVASALIQQAAYLPDYVVNAGGPLLFDSPGYGDVWRLFEAFSRQRHVSHPPGELHDAIAFRLPLWRVHRRLVDDDLAVRQRFHNVDTGGINSGVGEDADNDTDIEGMDHV